MESLLLKLFKETGCGAQCHGLVDIVVFVYKLDLISEVFSNLNDSVKHSF